MRRDYKYEMGFSINGNPIPDPSVFTGSESALDSEGGRDATGKLHRKMVATKHPTQIEYHNIDWEMMEMIMGNMLEESFQFTYPDPRTGITTMKAYCGDRKWTCTEANAVRGYIGDLSFSVIEY